MSEIVTASEEKGVGLKVKKKSNKVVPGQRKKIKTAKVRTGCRTCKARRIKCDETKPSCLRCLRISPTHCTGYEFFAPTPRPKPRVLAPLPIATIPRPPPSKRQFATQDEICSFRVYCEEVAPCLSYSNDTIWRRLLLQAGQENEFIQSAIYAIGEFKARGGCLRDEQTEMNGQQAVTRGYTGVEAVRLDKVALAHYDKFLAGTKRYITQSTREEGRRVAMIACLLVICIENMQYRPHNAVAHAKLGLKLLEDVLSSSSDSTSGRMGGGNDIEAELLQQFSRLDLQVVACNDVQSKAMHRKFKDEGMDRVRAMPECFRGVDEARGYLDLVMRRAFHFISFTDAHHKAKIWFGLEENVFRESLRARAAEDEGHPKEINIEQEKYTAEVRRWDRAFEGVFSDILWNPHHPDTVQALLMKVHSITTTLSLADHLSQSELHCDRLLPEFRNMIYLAKQILHNPLYKRGEFAFDMGLIYPLIVLILNCRDRKTRREAIDLLYEKPWREAHWDSEHVADVGKWVMEVEEEGVEGDFIPEWARVRSFEMNCKVETGIVHLICQRGFGDSLVLVECEMDWSRVKN